MVTNRYNYQLFMMYSILLHVGLPYTPVYSTDNIVKQWLMPNCKSVTRILFPPCWNFKVYVPIIIVMFISVMYNEC